MRRAAFIVLALGLVPGVVWAETVATVGKKTIDRAEVEKAVRAQLIAAENERYEALKTGLDQLIAEALFEQEAAARGVTVDQLQQTEIVDKIAQPTDDEIKKVFDENKEQLRDATLDQVKKKKVQNLLSKT